MSNDAFDKNLMFLSLQIMNLFCRNLKHSSLNKETEAEQKFIFLCDASVKDMHCSQEILKKLRRGLKLRLMHDESCGKVLVLGPNKVQLGFLPEDSGTAIIDRLLSSGRFLFASLENIVCENQKNQIDIKIYSA